MSSLSPRQMFLLDEACRPLRQAFAAAPHLVGSATRRDGQYRDVDIRLILEDERYDSLSDLFGPPFVGLLAVVIGEYLCSRTGLPVDFQIQRQSEANARHPGPRNPLGLRTLANYTGDGAPHDHPEART